jgi:rhamnogalacturonan endolyase
MGTAQLKSICIGMLSITLIAACGGGDMAADSGSTSQPAIASAVNPMPEQAQAIERVTDLPGASPSEPVMEPDAEAAVEITGGSAVASVTEPAGEFTTEPISEPTTEPTTETVIASTSEAGLEPVIAASADTATGTAGGTSSSAMTTSLVKQAASGQFALKSDTNFFTIDTGAGLIFKVRRVDDGASTRSVGDIASMVYNGVEYQNQTSGSHVNSGFDYLYKDVSKVSVSARQVDADHIKVTVDAGDLTHYYMARKGDARIYMATYFTSQPNTLGLSRFIVRVPIAVLPNGPTPSNIQGNTGAIESGDIFSMANGETRSKHYSNMRLKDWSHIGATGRNVGMWIVRDNNEGNSGGPFYRSLLNQAGTNQELTYIINYGMAQTESFRPGILNAYTLVFTNGTTPGMIDTSWFSKMGLTGFIAPSGRGRVSGAAIDGRNSKYKYTVSFSNNKAQYWTEARSSDGQFNATGMIPGTYTMKIYKNELAVENRTVTVNAGTVTSLNAISITGDPSAASALWRIGDWDGTPAELLNGDKVTTMHPSDVRMRPWATSDYVVGASSPATGFPAYQWKDINGSIKIRFNLTQNQVGNSTVRVGITTAYANGRPVIKVNNWSAGIPNPSTQPGTRSLTVGTYRGNNTMYAFNVPASALVVGENVLTLSVASGSGGSRYLSAGVSYDAVDFIAR